MRPKKRILCVDDDEQALSVLAFTLRIHGYNVFATSTPQEAIAIFVEDGIHMVITDHVMPNFPGDKLILQLKQIDPHIPMVMLGDPQKMNNRDGADALLDKRTISTLELLERVKIMCARKRGPRPGHAPAKQPSLSACLV